MRRERRLPKSCVALPLRDPNKSIILDIWIN
jgi:hypothetical protein